MNDKSIRYINTPDQSKTDFKKSLDWTIEQKFSQVSIFGLSGKSDDHFLGNIYTFNEFSHLINLQAFTDTSIITPCIGKNNFDSFTNQKVSLFCLENPSLISSKNLEYELDSFELHPSDNATRNVSKGNTFTIESSSKVLVFQIVN
jgi:thiamine pyrophosphokinase